jgi:hypothetical protein
LQENIRVPAPKSTVVNPTKSHFIEAGHPALVNGVQASLHVLSVPPSGPGTVEERQTPAPHAASDTHG